MPIYLAILIAGFGGGALRGIIGFVKHQYAYKNVKFELSYFFTMLGISGSIGVLTAAAAESLGISFSDSALFTPAMAFVAGYAGGDFLEGLYKIIFKKNLFLRKEKR